MDKRKFEDIWNKLPETTAKKLFHFQAVNNFIHCLERGDDPYSIIDQMFVYYTEVINYQDNQLKEYYLLGTPEQLRKMLLAKITKEEKDQLSVQ